MTFSTSATVPARYCLHCLTFTDSTGWKTFRGRRRRAQNARKGFWAHECSLLCTKMTPVKNLLELFLEKCQLLFEIRNL
jgi:hypothetical protein